MNTRIIRVFPRGNSNLPVDRMAFIGDVPLFRPDPADVDEVHVSCVFTWDKAEAERLAEGWRHYYRNVKLGGPAYGDPGGEFEPGMYLWSGITITTRGCPNNCSFCLVPKREGKFRELTIKPGFVINDNNILAASRAHFEGVCEMLRAQPRAAIFRGGLEAARLTDWHVDQLRGLRINELWFACDHPHALMPLKAALAKLPWLRREQKRCYVLVGHGDETPASAEARLLDVWDAGCLPFAQLYQDDSGERRQDRAWHELVRTWSRPAACKAAMAKKEAICAAKQKSE